MPNMEPYPTSHGWPSKHQELLLKAAILNNQEAVACWQRWHSLAEPGKAGKASRFLLPKVYHNLLRQKHRIKPNYLQYLRKLYLTTYLHNINHLRTLDEIAKLLGDAGVRVTLLKGCALTLLYYKDPGIRPMADIDILIPVDKRETALQALQNSGWKPNSRGSKYVTNSFFDTVHAYDFHNTDGRMIDLHWHVLHECCYTEADLDLANASAPYVYNGNDLYVLNPIDQLTHACVQGARCHGIPYLRWALDAATIINAEGDSLDWNRLLHFVKKHRLVLPVRDSLCYLNERLEILIPHQVIKEMRSINHSKAERFEYNYKRKKTTHTFFSFLPISWFDYSRTKGSQSVFGKVIGFPKYMMNFLGVGSLKDIVYVISGAIRIRRSKDLGD